MGTYFNSPHSPKPALWPPVTMTRMSLRAGGKFATIRIQPHRQVKLDLQRLFSRSMSIEFTEPKPPPPRSRGRRMMLVVLAGVLAIVGTLAGGYYFATRPVALRIAVGPPNSDDLRVVQALTQAFAQSHSYI